MRNSRASNKKAFKHFKVREAGEGYEGSQCRRYSRDEKGLELTLWMAQRLCPQIACDAEIKWIRRNLNNEGNSLHHYMAYLLFFSLCILLFDPHMCRKEIFSSPISWMGKLRSKLAKIMRTYYTAQGTLLTALR